MSLINYNEAYPGALDSSANNMSTCLRPGRRQLVSIQDTHQFRTPINSGHPSIQDTHQFRTPINSARASHSGGSPPTSSHLLCRRRRLRFHWILAFAGMTNRGRGYRPGRISNPSPSPVHHHGRLVRSIRVWSGASWLVSRRSPSRLRLKL